jgi:hypothetical protein
MRNHFIRSLGSAIGAAAALISTSCTYNPYNPYYPQTSVSGSYGSGFGDGFGYGGRSFSTSLFVTTGRSQWGYDPGCHSYYDYHRRCYYDPYLSGYYPLGYRPTVIYGVPHPYGWQPGAGHVRPPSRISNVTIVNYRDRESAYRSSGYEWAKTLRRPTTSPVRPSQQWQRPVEQEQRPRSQEERPMRFYQQTKPESRPSNGFRPSQNSYSRENEVRSSRQADSQNPMPVRLEEGGSRQKGQSIRTAAPQADRPAYRGERDKRSRGSNDALAPGPSDTGRR